MAQIGKLIVITGATASGKDTLVAELLKINPTWQRVVTTTTRPPRLNEQNGIDYDFVNLATFRKMKADGEFLETVEYAGNSYGTTKTALSPLFKEQTLIWRIDASRSAKINQLFDDKIKRHTIVIYIALPDQKTLYQRLHDRGISEAEIKQRIKQDMKDWNEGRFNHVVTNFNGHLSETVQKVMDIVKKLNRRMDIGNIPSNFG